MLYMHPVVLKWIDDDHDNRWPSILTYINAYIVYKNI